MEKEKEQKKPTLVSDILADFFLNSQFTKSDQWFLLKLWQKWEHFIKVESMKDSKPVAYHKGRLLLWVSDSVQLQEMNFYIEELKENISKFFEKEWVKEIYFTVNRDMAEKKEKTMKKLVEYFPD